MWLFNLFNENVYRATNHTVEKKHKLFNEKKLNDLIPLAVEKRKKSLGNADKLWLEAKKNFEKNGIEVFFAENGKEARDFIKSKLKENELIVKGKSLTTEEIQLRQFLEKIGHEVIETDLGEWIIQQRNELPSHFTAPALHLSAEDVRKMINKKFKTKLSSNIQELTDFVRKHLREKFLKATTGIIGANFVIANPSTIIAVSNEGNISLSARLPEKIFVVTGYDRIYDNAENMENIQKLLTSSATGQYYTSYIDFIKKPLPHQEIFLIVLDNGRKALLNSEFKDAARCIRCASCLNICPVYKEIGGHKFGKVYHGGIGSLLTAFTGNKKDAGKIAEFCLRCGSCEPECPMEIPISKLVAKLSSNYNLPVYLKIPLKMMKESKNESEKKNKNLIFVGCAFRTPMFKKVNKKIKSYAKILNADIVEQGCCGMPHFYKGLLDESERRVKSLGEIFKNYETVYIPCSSGFSFLKERFGEKIKLMSVEVSKLYKNKKENNIKTYYHLPCHLKHLKDFNEKSELLKIIEIEDWEHEEKCCGSAGTFWISHPLISKKILSRKREKEQDFEIITSCPSCYIQLKRIFKERVKHSMEKF
ncbi:LUD domain-containing protein [Thermotomaculum hydrothermale]|uniref:LUD domain-containing protein n=1 Tax=Thermotomaculum hydrothermale TaxID=981385 RepID=UPI0019161C7E|nr:LUD domain-containing protein [Thermotomaculum hydrothermale]